MPRLKELLGEDTRGQPIEEFWKKLLRPNCYGNRYECEARVKETCPNHEGCGLAYFKKQLKKDSNLIKRMIRRIEYAKKGR